MKTKLNYLLTRYKFHVQISINKYTYTIYKVIMYTQAQHRKYDISSTNPQYSLSQKGDLFITSGNL